MRTHRTPYSDLFGPDGKRVPRVATPWNVLCRTCQREIKPEDAIDGLCPICGVPPILAQWDADWDWLQQDAPTPWAITRTGNHLPGIQAANGEMVIACVDADVAAQMIRIANAWGALLPIIRRAIAARDSLSPVGGSDNWHIVEDWMGLASDLRAAVACIAQGVQHA